MTRDHLNDRTANLGQNEADLLFAILPHIPFDGWTKKAIMAGAESLCANQSAELAAFPNLPDDLLIGVSKLINQQLSIHIERVTTQAETSNMRFHEKIIEAIMRAYGQFKPFRPAMINAAGLMANPYHGKLVTGLLFEQADHIWREFGDKSLDFNYYSKRGLLSLVLSSSLLVYLYDESDDLSDTRAFLARRIDNVLSIPKIKQAARDRCAHTKQVIKSVLPSTPFGTRNDVLKMRGL
ncbi:MAG: COQ9 family protein [Alphaproteobacteria bacterium]